MSIKESRLNQVSKENFHLDKNEQTMKKSELIFIPSPLMGHVVSTVRLAKTLVEQYQQLSITVLITKFPFDDKVVNYSRSLSADSSSGVRYIELTPEETSLKMHSQFSFIFEFIDSHKSCVRDILEEISNTGTSDVAGVVVGMFCTSMIDVANEFGVPTYVFYSSGAAILGLALHLQSLRDSFGEDVASYLDKDIDLAIPTYINPVPAKLLPGLVADKEGGASTAFLDQAKRYREAKGIIVNTFLELESHAVQALGEDKTLPPVYTAGPILNLKGSRGENQEDTLILKWLDLQPNSSVVFLCFGSRGSFSGDQVMEIAYALEHSGHRFLWSLRKPPAEGMASFTSEYENLEELLPKGFLQRTAGIGKVIGWAPQMEVLSHPAVGGFVSHCGWNSTLESVWCGVPMAAIPLYAEQQVNAFLMVKDFELAVEIKLDHRKDSWASTDDIVKAEVIENGIRHLMNQENEIMRNKVKKMKEKCRLALKEGGSSSTSLRCFVDDIVKNNK